LRLSLYSLRRIFLGLKYSFPKRSSLVIYDSSNSECLIQQIPRLQLATVLDVRKVEFYLPILLLSILEQPFWTFNYYSAYKVAFIRYCRPKIVVSMIDNHEFFLRLKSYLPSITTCFVQNARRGAVNDIFESITRCSRYHVDAMFVYSQPIASLYSSFVSGSSVVIGSFHNNLYPIPADNQQSSGLLFVSQWRPRSGFRARSASAKLISHDTFYRPDVRLFRFLIDYCQQRNIALTVLPVSLAGSARLEEELDFFRRHSEGQPYSVSISTYRGDTYQSLSRYSLTITLTSTLGLESFARGNRVYFVNCRASCLESHSWRFGWPAPFAESGLFWNNSLDTQCLPDDLDTLMALSASAWKEVCKKYSSELMIYDQGNSVIVDYLSKYC